MINLDDLDPPRPILKPVDLQQMSLDDLREYIGALAAEIDRAKTMIAKKEAHRSGLDTLFRS